MKKLFYYCDGCGVNMGDSLFPIRELRLYSHSEPSGAGDSVSIYENALLCQQCMVDFVHFFVTVSGDTYEGSIAKQLGAFVRGHQLAVKNKKEG